jgi:hypothetical protein
MREMQRKYFQTGRKFSQEHAEVAKERPLRGV